MEQAGQIETRGDNEICDNDINIGRDLGYYGYTYYRVDNSNEEDDEQGQQSANNPEQVIPLVSGGGTCRNKVATRSSTAIV
jgi:hypothetical protein